MFAVVVSRYLQVTLAEMNLRNDWLIYLCPEGGSSSVTRPHGIEKDAMRRRKFARIYGERPPTMFQENLC